MREGYGLLRKPIFFYKAFGPHLSRQGGRRRRLKRRGKGKRDKGKGAEAVSKSGSGYFYLPLARK